VKPPRFAYVAATTVDQAVRSLHELGSEAKVLAGGQSLMPMLSMRLARPDALVDVNRVPGLDSITRHNGELVLGALVRHHDAATSAVVAEACPLLTQALPFVGHPSIRHRGTVAGSLAHADPAAELPAVALALGATMVATSVRGERRIASDDFFRSWFTTALEPDELLTEVRFRAQPADTGSSFLEVARRHGDFAQVGIAATLRVQDGLLRDPRLVAVSAGPVPVRLLAAEAALADQPLGDASIAAAATAAAEEIQPGSDVHSPADYKRAALRALLARAVGAAADDSMARSA
jgi:carbon-monoxide dehydrogenase medium subunit